MGDSSKEFVVDAVAQFVQSTAWHDAVSEFLEANYTVFLDAESDAARAECKVAGYTLEQFQVFTAFKDVVERLLEQLMADLGCSGEDLVAALEQNVKREVWLRGERRFFIKTLLSFDDYDAFCDKISQYAAEKRGTTLNGDVSLANDPTGEDGGDSSELSEWKLQEMIARSILDAKALGQLEAAEEAWVPWAEAMIEMAQQTQGTTESQEAIPAEIDSKDEGEQESASAEQLQQQSPQDSRMKELEQTLIRERLKVDLLVAQRTAEANATLKRQMLHLVADEVRDDQDHYADSVVAEEEDLAAQIQQVETIQDRLKEVKTKCFEFKDVQQQQMDTVYLYLKEKVHYQQDLVSQEQEIAAFIFTQIDQRDAGLIPLILEWLLLESEQLRIQNYVQELLNEPQHAGYWTQSWDEASQAYYYINSATNESVWEPPTCGYYDVNQDFQWEPAAVVSEYQTSDETAQEVESIAAAEGIPSVEDATNKLEAAYHRNDGETSSSDLIEMESVLERISREHDEERKRLELVFQLEKARQKEELRKRKEKKRREKLAKKKKRQEETGGASVEDPSDAKCSAATESLDVVQPPAPLTARLAAKADSKAGDDLLSIAVPGHGRIDLSHLLSEGHARRHHKRKGINLGPLQQSPHMLLHPNSLQYLAGQMMKRQQDSADVPRSARKEIVLEELIDEK